MVMQIVVTSLVSSLPEGVFVCQQIVVMDSRQSDIAPYQSLSAPPQYLDLVLVEYFQDLLQVRFL